MDTIKFKVTENYIDKTVREILLSFHLAKEKIYDYGLKKAFLINGQEVNQNAVCKLNDELEIIINENIDVAPIGDLPLIYYEDANYLIVHKPRGMLVHDDGVSEEITLTNMVANYYKTKHIHRLVRFNNRLDKETEGLVLFSKDALSNSYLNYLIEERKVIKKYYALCYNKFSHLTGTIDLPLGNDRHDKKKMVVYPKGKEAITDYQVLVNKPISLVDITLHTGRTHQIRVHLSYNHHPLLGDELYGKEDQYPLMLQAYYYSFTNPFLNKQVEGREKMSEVLENVLSRRD